MHWLLLVKDLIEARDPVSEMVNAFKLFDEEGSGKICYRTLKKIAKCVSTLG